MNQLKLRVGQGIDVHAFCEGDHLMIGGVRIPNTQGVSAHSDGDVLLHAIADALLGATGLGDIGHFFPDTDSRFQGMDSRNLLRAVMESVVGEQWKVVNVDCTIVAEQPKLAPYISKMKESIAGILNIDRSAVGIKATTTERMGFIGREEGLAAFAVALLGAHV